MNITPDVLSGLAWRTATASGQNQSGPNCVEVAPFRKATRSGGNGDNCVEVSHLRTATRSGGNGDNCVQVGTFTKAAHSNPSGNCVQAAPATADQHAACTPETCTTPGIEPGDVVVRDSKLGDDSPLLVFKPEAWEAFCAEVADGREDTRNGKWIITDPSGSGVTLFFTAGEWEAFTDGCQKHEFTMQALTSVPA
jgi:hypothetical protein